MKKEKIETFYRLTEEEKERLRGTFETEIFSKTIFADKLTGNPELSRELMGVVIAFLNEAWENVGKQKGCLVSVAEILDFLEKLYPKSDMAITLLDVVADADKKEKIYPVKEKKIHSHGIASKVGENIYFGKCYMKWEIIGCEGDRMLLLCKESVQKRAFINKLRYNTRCLWQNSDIRSWLNREFLKEMFTIKEQEKILLTTVANSIFTPSAHYQTREELSKQEIIQAGETEDKIFLLSEEEVKRYLGEKENYWKASGWLRSPSPYYGEGRVMQNDGVVVQYLVIQTADIHPAMWISAEELL